MFLRIKTNFETQFARFDNVNKKDSGLIEENILFRQTIVFRILTIYYSNSHSRTRAGNTRVA